MIIRKIPSFRNATESWRCRTPPYVPPPTSPTTGILRTAARQSRYTSSVPRFPPPPPALRESSPPRACAARGVRSAGRLDGAVNAADVGGTARHQGGLGPGPRRRWLVALLGVQDTYCGSRTRGLAGGHGSGRLNIGPGEGAESSRLRARPRAAGHSSADSGGRGRARVLAPEALHGENAVDRGCDKLGALSGLPPRCRAETHVFSSKRGPRTDAGGAEKGCPAASACSGWRRPEPASGGTFPAGLRPSCTPWRPGTRVGATERVSTNSRALGAVAVAGFRPGAAWRAAPARRDQTNACAGAIAPCGAAVRGAGSALDARAARERAVGTAGALGKARGFCRFCHIFLSSCFLFVVVYLACMSRYTYGACIPVVLGFYRLV
jgi:hypothetical protein